MNRKILAVVSLLTISALAVTAAEATFKELYASALKNYNLKKYDDCLQDADKALAAAGNDIEKLQALTCKYNCYNSRRQFADAASVAGEVVKLDKITGAQRNQWQLNRLIAYFNGGKFDDCIAACDVLIGSKEPENREQGYYYKHSAYLRKNDMLRAQDAASKFVEYTAEMKHPMYYRAIITQMTMLNNKKDYGRALAALPAADAVNIPSSIKSEYYNLLGNIYQNQKRYPDAVAAFEKATQNDMGYHGGVGWYLMGETYAAMNRDNEAMYAFTKCYELNGSHPYHKTMSVVRCAELLNKAGKPDSALPLLEKAETLPGATPEWVVRGKILAAKILAQQGKKEAAQKQLSAAINIKGASAGIINQAKSELSKLK